MERINGNNFFRVLPEAKPELRTFKFGAMEEALNEGAEAWKTFKTGDSSSISSKTSSQSSVKDKEVDYAKIFRGWISKFSYTVSASDLPVIDFCTKNNIPIRTVGGPKSSHPISHTARQVAVSYILSQNITGARLVVADLFGSPRNRAFNPATSSFKTPGSSAIEIEFKTLRPYEVRGDVARGFVDNQPGQFDILLIQDVYQYGHSYESQLTPEIVLDYLNRSQRKLGYVICRMFTGEMGADACGEGVWIRKDGLIHFSPGDGETNYAGHPDLSWLHSRQQGLLDVSFLTTIGPFSVYKVGLGRQNAVALGPLLPPTPEVELLQFDRHIEEYDYLRKFVYTQYDKMFPPEKISVHGPTFRKLQHLQLRGWSGSMLDGIFSKVEHELRQYPSMLSVEKRFPEAFKMTLDGTFRAVLFFQKEAGVSRVLRLRKDTLKAEEKVKELRSSVLLPEPTKNWKSVFVGLLLFFALRNRQLLRKVGYKAIIEGLFLLSSESATIAGELWKACRMILVRIMKNIFQMRVSGTANLFPKTGVFGVIGEEMMRTVSPESSLPVALFEWQRDGSNSWMLHIFLGVISKYAPKGLANFFVRCCVHYWWNRQATQNKNLSSWESFQESYHDQQPRVADDFEQIVSIPAGSVLHSVDCKYEGEDEIRGKLKISYAGVTLSWVRALQFGRLVEAKKQLPLYPVLITHRLLHRPSASFNNLLASIRYRLLKIPAYEPQQEFWGSVQKLFVVERGYTESWNKEKVLKAQGSKKAQRTAAAFNDLDMGTDAKRSKSVMVKNDETISASKFGLDTIKPRAICNMSTVYHAETTIEAHEISTELKKKWNVRKIYVNNRTGRGFCIVYACGMLPGDLARLMDDIFQIPEISTYVVSGDDFFFWDAVHNVWVEGDINLCDQSHSELSLTSILKIFRAMGMSEQVEQSYYEQCTKEFVSYHGLFKILCEIAWILPTGTTATTIINSCVPICCALYSEEYGVSIEESFKRAGFKITMHVREHYSHVTFLKGWWQDVGGDQTAWFPLPSAILKLGKILKDPVVLTKYKTKGKKKRLTPKEAVKRIAHEMSLSFGHMPETYPILGPFVATLKRLGTPANKRIDVSESSNKPHCVALTVKDEVYSAIEKRYGITKLECEEFHKILSMVSDLPTMVSHTTIDKLYEVDYGC